MRISDWSSDVCSSDLGSDDDARVVGEIAEELRRVLQHLLDLAVRALEERPHLHGGGRAQTCRRLEVVDEVAVGLLGGVAAGARELGRASCRERACQSVAISGVAVSLIK